MRSYILAVVVLLTSFSVVRAEEVVGKTVGGPSAITPELVQAHYDFQLAQLRLQQYRRVTLPQQRRQLNESIRYTDREVLLLKRRLRNYRPFLLVDEFSPVRTATDSHQLTLLAAQARSRHLRDARIHQMRFSRQNDQLLQLELLKAAAQLAQLQRASTAE